MVNCQDIVLTGNENNNVYGVYGYKVDVYSSLKKSSMASGCLMVSPIVSYEWELEYRLSSLVTCHNESSLIAYYLKAFGQKPRVKIFKRDTFKHCLLKEFDFGTLTLEFSKHSTPILAVFDNCGTLRIYMVEINFDDELSVSLILSIQVFSQPAHEKCYLIKWFPFPYITKPSRANIIAVSLNTNVFLLDINPVIENKFKNIAKENNFDSVHSFKYAYSSYKSELGSCSVELMGHEELVYAFAFDKNFETFVVAAQDGRVTHYCLTNLSEDSIKPVMSWYPHGLNPVSSIFLDDWSLNDSVESEVYLITAANHNREICLWRLRDSHCLQTVTFLPPGLDNETSGVDRPVDKTNPMPCLVLKYINSAKLLLASDIRRTVMYALDLSTLPSVSDRTCPAFRSLSEFTLVSPCITFDVQNAVRVRSSPLTPQFVLRLHHIEGGDGGLASDDFELSLITIHPRALQLMVLHFLVPLTIRIWNKEADPPFDLVKSELCSSSVAIEASDDLPSLEEASGVGQVSSIHLKSSHSPTTAIDMLEYRPEDFDIENKLANGVDNITCDLENENIQPNDFANCEKVIYPTSMSTSKSDSNLPFSVTSDVRVAGMVSSWNVGFESADSSDRNRPTPVTVTSSHMKSIECLCTPDDMSDPALVNSLHSLSNDCCTKLEPPFECSPTPQQSPPSFVYAASNPPVDSPSTAPFPLPPDEVRQCEIVELLTQLLAHSRIVADTRPLQLEELTDLVRKLADQSKMHDKLINTMMCNIGKQKVQLDRMMESQMQILDRLHYQAPRLTTETAAPLVESVSAPGTDMSVPPHWAMNLADQVSTQSSKLSNRLTQLEHSMKQATSGKFAANKAAGDLAQDITKALMIQLRTLLRNELQAVFRSNAAILLEPLRAATVRLVEDKINPLPRIMHDFVGRMICDPKFSNGFANSISPIIAKNLSPIYREEIKRSLVPAFTSGIEKLFKDMDAVLTEGLNQHVTTVALRFDEAFGKTSERTFELTQALETAIESFSNKILCPQHETPKTPVSNKQNQDRFSVRSNSQKPVILKEAVFSSRIPQPPDKDFSSELKDVLSNVRKSIRAGQYATAIEATLNTTNQRFLFVVLREIPLIHLFSRPISQNVLLSLINQLTYGELLDEFDLKVTFLLEALAMLDTKDGSITVHGKQHINILKEKLDCLNASLIPPGEEFRLIRLTNTVSKLMN